MTRSAIPWLVLGLALGATGCGTKSDVYDANAETGGTAAAGKQDAAADESGKRDSAAREGDPAPAKAKPPKETTKKLFDGQSLTGWKVADKFVFEEHGEVEVRDGVIYLGKGTPATGIVFEGEFPKLNYEVQLDAKRTDGQDFFCGLTFPYRDSHCTFIVGGWGGGVTGLSNVDHFSAAENETSDYMEFQNDVWYSIRLRVTGDAIQAWIEDETVIDLETADHTFEVWWEQEPMRPFGISTWHTAAAVRNIVLKRLPAAASEEATEQDAPAEAKAEE